MRHEELVEKLYDMTLDGGGDGDQSCGDVSENGRWYGTCENLRLGGEEFAIKYAIVTQDDQGFKDAETFTSKAEFEERWSEIEMEVEAFYTEAEPTEPDEGDYVISDARGGGEAVSQHGWKYLDTFPDRDSAEAFIREHANTGQFWPSVWVLSDHGNWHLVEGFKYEVEAM